MSHFLRYKCIEFALPLYPWYPASYKNRFILAYGPDNQRITSKVFTFYIYNTLHTVQTKYDIHWIIYIVLGIYFSSLPSKSYILPLLCLLVISCIDVILYSGTHDTPLNINSSQVEHDHIGAAS